MSFYKVNPHDQVYVEKCQCQMSLKFVGGWTSDISLIKFSKTQLWRYQTYFDCSDNNLLGIIHKWRRSELFFRTYPPTAKNKFGRSNNRKQYSSPPGFNFTILFCIRNGSKKLDRFINNFLNFLIEMQVNFVNII